MKQVLIKPVITEKSTALQEDIQQYVFVVNKQANKLEIRKAIEEMYGVTVDSINTSVVPSKSKMRYTKSGIIDGRKSSYKKAIVKLVDGDEIDFYANI